MRIPSRPMLSGALMIAIGSCGLEPTFTDLPIETNLAFTNFSTRFYAALQVRASTDGDTAYVSTPLLAPGATVRTRFLDLLGTGCPSAVDLRIFLYRRVNEDVPIGLDAGEAVESSPIVAGEVLNIPACGVQELESFTVVNWDAPVGTGRVKIAQDTPVDEAIRASGIFPNVDAAWEIAGVEAGLDRQAPPAHASVEPIRGRVILADGTPLEGIGVLLRTRFRIRLDDEDAGNDPDAGLSAPIAVATTDADGAFVLDRPPGGYEIEPFSDAFSFRPGSSLVETPVESFVIVAEPL